MIVISTAKTKHLVNEDTIESVTFDHEQHTATITRPQLEPGHLSTQTIPDVEYVRTLGENERVSWDNSELDRAYKMSSFYCKKATAYNEAFDRLRNDTLRKIRWVLGRLECEDYLTASEQLSKFAGRISQGEYTPDFPPQPQQV